MKTKKRFLSILLSLALVLGLFPGMSLTAYAELYNDQRTFLSGEQRLSDLGAGNVISQNCTIYKNNRRGITIYDTDGTTVLVSKGIDGWERFKPGYDIVILTTPGGNGTSTAKKCFICSFTSAPTAIEDLNYNGSEQTLINVGSGVTGGTMYFQLGESSVQAPTGEWMTTAPKGVSGEYYVWYKVVATEDNYADYPPTCITVSIEAPQGKIPVDENKNGENLPELKESNLEEVAQEIASDQLTDEEETALKSGATLTISLEMTNIEFCAIGS